MTATSGADVASKESLRRQREVKGWTRSEAAALGCTADQLLTGMGSDEPAAQGRATTLTGRPVGKRE